MINLNPESLEDWKPIFERALQEYVLEQEGGMTEINTRNLLKFIMKKRGYPEIIDEEKERHVARLLNRFFSEFFGPLWDGVKYRDNKSRGRSLFVGTDNLLDVIRYNGVIR